MNPPLVSVVVIGRNEGPRLSRALRAVERATHSIAESVEVVYVDSASSDGSVDVARGFEGVRIVELDPEHVGAAAARNAGIAVSTGRYVQLVDGDMELDVRWLPPAVAYLESRAAAAVAGTLMERELGQSPWTRAFGQDWWRPPGPAETLGGAALWRRDVLDRLGGFDTSLRVGEDPDLALRARDAGHELWVLDVPMATHDLDLRTAAQYWRRAVSVGESRANVGARHESRSRDLVRPLTAATVVALATAVAPVATLCVLALTALLLVARRAVLDLAEGSRPVDALVHALHVYAVRLPVALGSARRRLELRSSR